MWRCLPDRLPGGTVTLRRIIQRARAESASSSPSRSTGGLGSVGVGGGIDRQAVESPPASDGGSTTADVGTPLPDDDAEMLTDEPELATRSRSNPDRYCGDCAEFDYVRTEDGFQPYCGFFDEPMDDMAPCEHWEPRSGAEGR